MHCVQAMRPNNNEGLYSMSQKTIHLTFVHNFSKCRPIFKILLVTDSEETIYMTVTGCSISP